MVISSKNMQRVLNAVSPTLSPLGAILACLKCERP